MRYVNKTTNERYSEGNAMTRYLEDGSLFSGIPTNEQLTAWGFEPVQEVVSPAVEYVPSYEELVVEKIRERYTLDDELAILRQRDVKKDEFEEYFEYCEECKREAKNNSK